MTLSPEDGTTDSEPLVLLPGMNCSPRLWEPVVRQLTGRLGSRALLCEELVAESIDAAVEQLLGRLPERFALAGLSLGGIVAMAMMRQAPDRITRLCLLDTNARGPTPTQRASWSAARQALGSGSSARDLQREWLPGLLSTQARPALDEAVLRMAEDCGAGALDQQLAAQGTRVDQRPFLGMITAPTLIICGSADALCPVSYHQEIHVLVPGSALVILPQVGHLATLESPGAVAEAMAQWLER